MSNIDFFPPIWTVSIAVVKFYTLWLILMLKLTEIVTNVKNRSFVGIFLYRLLLVNYKQAIFANKQNEDK